MAISLQKGQRVDLGLTKAHAGLGWAANQAGGQAFDLDASAFLLNADGKLVGDDYFVFFNNQTSGDGAVASSGDNRDGEGEGDDESLTIEFPKLDKRVEQIVICVTIHEAEVRKQNFGQIRNSYIRICNSSTGEELYKYELDEDFSVETAVEFGRFYKRNGAWKFEAVGRGVRGGLEALVEKYQ